MDLYHSSRDCLTVLLIYLKIKKQLEVVVLC